ncbi:ABC transporter permease [Niveispirillum sp.]|uniref:ABC transporter permease n=1 Tax=Niveispirillum sp. TaxID=1917217 RepID=UPI001B628B13|nr:ABC transporter permease [Niveispirillum sp.]MBP7338893.1 ABC transporter permease [Niveispirillum sp.]
MLRNWVMVALRNLLRHRLHAVLNLSGLAVGLAACLLILLFVRNETGYDRSIKDADRIYQATLEWRLPGRKPERGAYVQHRFGEAFAQAHPEVEAFTRMTGGSQILRTADRKFYETTTIVDANFLEMFGFPLLAGDARTALTDPSSIVLTEAVARKYFGDEPALGRLLTLDNKYEVKVTAVVAKLPSNISIQFDVLLPYSSPSASYMRNWENNWGNTNNVTFLRLKPGASVDPLLAGMRDWVKRTFLPLATPQGPIELTEIAYPSLRRLLDVHLDPMAGDIVPGASRTEVATFTAVAFLILLIACINFTNLATARATQRAREVSVRKVVGARRGQLVAQFLGESLLMTFLAMLLALALVELALPGFNAFLGKDLSLDVVADPMLGSVVLGLILLVGVGAGAYPAFFLTSFNPAQVMKGASAGVGGGSGRLRTALVIVQFSISIALMVATSVVYGQLLYAQHKDLGYNTENVVIIGYFTTDGVKEKRETFLQMIRESPAVQAAGMAGSIPGDGGENNALIRRPGAAVGTDLVMRQDTIGDGFFEALGMRMVVGRTFDRDRGTDAIQRPQWMMDGKPPPEGAGTIEVTGSVILNRSATKALGFDSPEAAVGEQVLTIDSPQTIIRGTIVGVVEDFHFKSVHEPIRPAFYIFDNGNHHAMAVRSKAGRFGDVIAEVDRIWAELVPDRPIQRSFFDVNIANQYQREQKTSQMFATFSGLAIFISCLGLYGLASFTAERRTKEIGLRKVLGASVPDIVRLLVWQFSKPVLVANLIAWPVAWFCMDRWLSDFTYRIDLNPLLFLGAGSAALAIAWLTVGLHAARVAQAKPIKALRYE